MEVFEMSSRTVQPGFSFEYFMWIFTRISGLALILLAMMGMTGALLMGARTQMDLPTLMRWAFFPNPNHVVNSNIPDVAVGWATAYWQIMQLLMIFLAVTHGFNGLRVVLEDFLGQTFLRPMLRGLIFLLWMFALITAIYVILAS
jgi:succinate dehydrogenase / fumarate reductase membrane anchor subunit